MRNWAVRMVARRFAVMVPTLLVVYTVVFFMAHATPGSPWNTKASGRPLTAQEQHNLNVEFHLDAPILVQYKDYLLNALHGDFGSSFQNREQSVSGIIGTYLPTSLQLGIAALVLGVVLGLALGALAALHERTWIDGAVSAATTFGIALPTYVITAVMIVLLGLRLGLVPVYGWNGIFSSSAIVPVIALALAPMAAVTRYFRASMLETIHSDYVRTAWAKGLRSRRVIVHHMARNALVPVITVVALYASVVVVGSFFVESIAGIPGLGHTFVQSIGERDYPLIMGTTLLFAVVLIVMNTLADVLQNVVDPRVRRAR